MKYLYTLLFFIAAFALKAQTITGHVYDKALNEPLPAVFLYLDGTTISTETNDKGFFSLDLKGRNTGTLVVSFLGYRTLRIENPLQYGKTLKIELDQELINVEEVAITGKTTFTRKQMLKVFRAQFLGESAIASSCKIENEDDVRLYFDSGTNTLRAEVKKPLRIKNKKLQYDVQFDLMAFEVQYRSKSLDSKKMRSSFFAGTTFFKDVSKSGSADKKRKKSYLGSSTHLMRTIAANDWQNQKFRLFVDGFGVKPDEYFTVTDTLDVKKITAKVTKEREVNLTQINLTNREGQPVEVKNVKVPIKYNVLYDGKDQSVFMLNKGVFFIDRFGLYSPINEIMFGGHISTLKAGDMLPADYEYKE